MSFFWKLEINLMRLIMKKNKLVHFSEITCKEIMHNGLSCRDKANYLHMGPGPVCVRGVIAFRQVLFKGS